MVFATVASINVSIFVRFQTTLFNKFIFMKLHFLEINFIRKFYAIKLFLRTIVLYPPFQSPRDTSWNDKLLVYHFMH